MKGNEEQFAMDENGLLSGGLSFLVTASHELKAPLALVRQLSLTLEAGDSNADETARMLRQIILVTERALRLTTDLSLSSRLEDSLFQLEPLNPQQICEEVAHELTPLYKARGREIRVGSYRRSVLGVANRDLLRRIMLNFGDNALHYGSAQLPVELRIATHQRRGMIRMGVRDYGPAIPADVWQRLQTRLGSDRQTLDARPQSSGLGLYIAGQFAEVMQGKIGATRHRVGATFYVDILASTQLSLL